MKKISLYLGCGETRVFVKMNEFGITRRRISEANKGISKTQEHKDKLSELSKGRWLGENNPKWKGGFYRDSLAKRYDSRYYKWRDEVIRKGDNKCSVCDKTLGITCECCGQKVQMYAHHVKPVKQYPELAFDVSNGILLCYSCHQNVHKVLS